MSPKTDGSGTAVFAVLKVISSTNTQFLVVQPIESVKLTINEDPIQLPSKYNVPRVLSGMAFGSTVKSVPPIVTVVGRKIEADWFRLKSIPTWLMVTGVENCKSLFEKEKRIKRLI